MSGATPSSLTDVKAHVARDNTAGPQDLRAIADQQNSRMAMPSPLRTSENVDVLLAKHEERFGRHPNRSGAGSSTEFWCVIRFESTCLEQEDIEGSRLFTS